MNPANSPSLLVWIGIVALVAWRLYARMRRLVGRQRLSPVRPWITVVLFPLLFLGLLLGAAHLHRGNGLGLLAGAGIGALLGAYGLRQTRFESTPTGLFYTPNAHLGVALSSLMALRIGYRLLHARFSGAAMTVPPQAMLGSPLTMLIFGTLAGYYVCYAIGLLRWRASLRAACSAAAPRLQCSGGASAWWASSQRWPRLPSACDGWKSRDR